MDGDFIGLGQRVLDQDQDLAFGIRTSVGDFTVIGFEAEEEVNGLYEVRIELASADPNVDLHDLMDTQANLAIYSKYSEVRYLTGIVMECARKDAGFSRTAYSMILRPSLARLYHVSDGRIWQHVNVVDATKELLQEHHINQVEWRLNENYPSREYLTQVPGERTLDFIRRILNEVGIFWYFCHQADQTRLIFTDSPLATPVLEHAQSVTYNNMPGGQSRGFWISRFSQHERLRSSDFELGEYWFKNPVVDFHQTYGRQENNGTSDSYKRYDYPGRYKDPSGVGKPFVKARIDAERVDATTGKGVTNNIHLCPGWHISITDHPDEAVNTSHFLLSVRHQGSQSSALEEEAPEGEATTYEATFTTMPGRLPYRPSTPAKPVIDGPQIGTVVGPEGEEIYCDEFGRVRVWLSWDRHAERRRSDGQREENATCWIRVAQNWAGAGWGHIAIPRINQEVLVSYIDGDCDQPLITGRAYNSLNRVPYKLPEHKTRMVIRSDSHKSPYKGFNELSFEDKAYNEELYVRAQKDMNIKVRNDRTKIVDHDETAFIGRDKTERVRGNKHASIRGGYSITVSANEKSDQFSDVVFKKNAGLSGLYSKFRTAISNVGHGSLSLFVESLRTVWIGGADTTTVGAAKTTSVGGQYSILTGAGFQVSSGTKHSVNARTIDLSAAESVHINVGESRFSMEKDGTITFKGKKVNIVTELETNLETGGDTKIESYGETAVYGSKIKLN